MSFVRGRPKTHGLSNTRHYRAWNRLRAAAVRGDVELAWVQRRTITTCNDPTAANRGRNTIAYGCTNQLGDHMANYDYDLRTQSRRATLAAAIIIIVFALLGAVGAFNPPAPQCQQPLENNHDG